MTTDFDWAAGYSAYYQAVGVNPDTWLDDGRRTYEIIDGTISNSDDLLMQSADFTVKEQIPEMESWIRIYLCARQDGAMARVPLFTGLISNPERQVMSNRTEYKLQCYSILKPLDDILLPRGWYAPIDMPVKEALKSFFRDSPCRSVLLDSSKRLTEPLIAEDDETELTMVLKILEAMNWRMVITGAGEIEVKEYSTDPVAKFAAVDRDMIESGVTAEYDLFSCPNCFRAISDDLTAIARDDSRFSQLSTVSRGREIWAQETDVVIGAGESLSAYAMRRLKEMQKTGMKLSYSRRFDPAVAVGDYIEIRYPEKNLSGIYRVTSQSITLGTIPKVSEEVTDGDETEDGE